MTEYESKAILHQIQLERVENGIVRKCLLQLENASRQLAKEIKKTSGVYTKKRYQEIRKYIKDVSKELKENINTDMDIDAFIEYELEAQVKLYKKYAGVNMVAPAKEQVITTATFTPYTATSTFENYLESLELGFFNVWDSQVRSGYINGLTTQTIVKGVMGEVAKNAQVADFGAIHQLRNSIQTNTRTALQSFASETRNLIYRQNAELIDGYKWVATLDRRTCLPSSEKVLTPNGYVNINEINVGDIVIGGSREERFVTHTFERDTDMLVEIELENGKKFRCTPDHLILTDKGWVEAGNLNKTYEIMQTM